MTKFEVSKEWKQVAIGHGDGVLIKFSCTSCDAMPEIRFAAVNSRITSMDWRVPSPKRGQDDAE